MTVRYITEKDFVPAGITHAGRHTEVEDGLFQIVYGVMQGGMSYDSIYDLIVRLSKEQKSEVVKRFKLLAWKVEVEAILTKLRKYDVNDFLVLVVIPFTEYVKDVPYTMNLFQLALFTIDEILERGDSKMKTIDDPKYSMPPKSIARLLGDYYFEFMEELPEEMIPDKPYYRSLLFDEMIRRDMTTFEINEPIADPETHELINAHTPFTLTPSQHFSQPERFFDIIYLSYGEEWKKLRTKTEIEGVGSSNNPADKKDYTLGIVGTVFFMVEDLSQETVDKKKKKKLVALMNYILENEPDEDTPRSYVDKLFGTTLKSHSFKFFDRVKKNLERYGFEVPKVIKEGWENKKK